MTSVLIGHTGFVGSNLARDMPFDLFINRSNLQSLRGARVRRLVCAGLPAAKWLANQKPTEDADNIRTLSNVLSTIEAQKVILISTIDVYPRRSGVDETFDCSSETNHAYGTNRLRFEEFLRNRFADTLVVRLPALFGPGLKKNVLYDLLHGHRLERINPASRFQWYPLAKLTSDLHLIEHSGLDLVNLFTEPVETRCILEKLFPGKIVGGIPDPLVEYDLHTRSGSVFGSSSPYVMTHDAVLAAMAEFVRREQIPR